jgi:hypothetical protein
LLEAAGELLTQLLAHARAIRWRLAALLLAPRAMISAGTGSRLLIWPRSTQGVSDTKNNVFAEW